MKAPINKSSQIAAVAHDPVTNTLTVRFAKGGVYHYSDVPAHHHDGLMNAESPGRYLSEHIKGKFAFKRTE